jgi:phenylacetate-coenzyme A ligase PaaK-like adenylate-forming protein
MLDTALAQAHLGIALIAQRRLRAHDLRRLVADLLATRAEYDGMPAELGAPPGAVSLPPEARRAVDERRLKRMARMAYDETVYYRALFDRLGLRPEQLALDRLAEAPITPKAALKQLPEAFISRRAQPSFQAFTTGTTGHPTAVWFSRYELELAAALSALALAVDPGLGPRDVLQISISSRAVLGLANTLQAARLVGAAAYPLGLIDPEETLSRLATPVHLPGKKAQVSALTTYPTYLGALIETGARLGYRARDLGLEHIISNGEILTTALRRRAEAFFGARLHDSFAMTETFPVAGVVCSQGHLHLSPEQGLVEVLRPADGRPAAPGEVGALVVTPFFPYRDTTLVWRLDTGDLVRRLDPGAPLTCEHAAIPATSPVLGKLALAAAAGGHPIGQRDILDLLEADEEIPLPCRYAVEPAEDGFDLHVLARRESGALASRLRGGAADRALPLRRLRLYTAREEMPRTLPMRADLREATFTRVHP